MKFITGSNINFAEKHTDNYEMLYNLLTGVTYELAKSLQ